MAGELDRRVRERLAGLTLEQKIGQLFVTATFGADAERPSPDDEGRNISAFGLPTPADVVRKFHVGGVAYFRWAGNTRDPRQVAGLSNGLQRAAIEDASGIPLFVAADQEQGAVVRLGPPFTELPGSMALGASGSERDAYQAALLTGTELGAVGVNQVYAPCVDVNANPANPVIGVRSFGADPQLVSTLGVAQARGFADAGVVATAKHFPGHGDTTVDSHLGVPVVPRPRGRWDATDAVPFRALVEAGVDSVMSAHIVMSALDGGSGDPATLSWEILSGILRNEFGYQGVVVTDSLQMQGVRAKYGDARVPVLALRAGADQLLMPPNLELAVGAVHEAVRTGELTEERIDQSVTRILTLKHARGLFDRPYTDLQQIERAVGPRRHHDTADRIADRTVTLVRDGAGLVPLDPAWQAVLVVGAGGEATTVLAEELEAYASWTCAVDTGDSPDDEAIRSAVARAKHHDIAIVLTKNAWNTRTDPSQGQQRLLAALLSARTRVAVVAVRDPYDLAYVPDDISCLATYSDAAVSMRALARVMVGAVEPRGRLPVDLPKLR